MELVYKNEKTLFTIALIISLLFWLALIVGTIGIALFYLLLFYIGYLFAQSAFISYIKGTGVKVSAAQYPDLHERVIACCKKIELESVPHCYVLRTDTFNALATKFRGQNFIVLFSDVVDALKDDPEAMNFYIGHELAHIKRKHLNWSPWLAPARILPVLGAAYSRACEYTCDRFGLFCTESPLAAQRGLLAIGAGDSRFLATDIGSYVDQCNETGKFWMSFHELTGTYPWLIKRTATIKELSEGREPVHPRRNPFAGFLSIFVPNVGIGGFGSLIVVVLIIGVLAAIALPAYQDYTTRARVSQAMGAAEPIRAAVNEHIMSKQEIPEEVIDLGDMAPDVSSVEQQGLNISIIDRGVVSVKFTTSNLAGKSFALVPYVADDTLNWRCESDSIPAKHLPASCRAE